MTAFEKHAVEIYKKYAGQKRVGEIAGTLGMSYSDLKQILKKAGITPTFVPEPSPYRKPCNC